MPRVSFEKQQSRNWFSLSLERTLSLQASFDPAKVLAIKPLFRELLFDTELGLLVTAICSSEAVGASTIENARGRPCESIDEESAELEPGFEELVYLSGNISHPSLFQAEDPGTLESPLLGDKVNELLKGDPPEEKTPFEVQVLSKFLDYPSRRTIRHEVITRRSHILELIAKDCDFDVLFARGDVDFSRVRLGIEQYATRLIHSTFGAVPIVVRRCYLEVSKDSLILHLSRSDPLNSPGPDISNEAVFVVLKKHLAAIGIEIAQASKPAYESAK